MAISAEYARQRPRDLGVPPYQLFCAHCLAEGQPLIATYLRCRGRAYWLCPICREDGVVYHALAQAESVRAEDRGS